ncbi:hypothetical protein EVAR_20647_1 [Eumeta japonica]|uniref:Uncharacterized protein n=1 Tax=Eumeta variegata TaxID=151549 RepID=A0A4C1VBX3_EUMVA|nr:hypothetical protein EVAR_20647_1 [Eumeta japonica]
MFIEKKKQTKRAETNTRRLNVRGCRSPICLYETPAPPRLACVCVNKRGTLARETPSPNESYVTYCETDDEGVAIGRDLRNCVCLCVYCESRCNEMQFNLRPSSSRLKVVCALKCSVLLAQQKITV